MQRLIRKLEAGGTARVAVLGGSMTRGHRCTDTVLGSGFDCAWSRRFRDWLPRQFPRWSFQLDNLAQGGWSLETWLASGRVHVEVADYDVILLDTGINSASLPHSVRGHVMDEVLWALLGPEREAGRRPVVLVTEAFRSCGAMRRECDTYCERGQQASVPYFGINRTYAWCNKWWHTQDNEMDVVRHYGVPVASYRDAVWPRLNQPPRLLSCFWNGLTHPTTDVHALFAAVVAHAFHGAVLQGCAAMVGDAAVSLPSPRPRPKETGKPGGDEQVGGSEGSDEEEDELELKGDALWDEGKGDKDGEEAEGKGEEDEAEGKGEEDEAEDEGEKDEAEDEGEEDEAEDEGEEDEEEDQDEEEKDGPRMGRKLQQGQQQQLRGGPESSSSGGSGRSRKDSESSGGGGGGWNCLEEPVRKMHSSANLTPFCSSIVARAAASFTAAAESDGKGSGRGTAKTTDGTASSTQGEQQQHGNSSLTHVTRTFMRLAAYSPATWRAERVRGGWRFGEDVPGNGKPGWFVDIGNVSTAPGAANGNSSGGGSGNGSTDADARGAGSGGSSGSYDAAYVELSAPSGGGEAHTVTFSVVLSPNPQLEVMFLHTYHLIGGVRAYLHAPDAAADVGAVAAGPQRQAPGEVEAQDGGQAEAASERASAQEARRQQQQRRQQGQVGGSGGGGGSLTRGSEASVADAAAAPPPLAALRERALSIFTISGLNHQQFSVPHTAVLNERLEAERVGRGPREGVTVLRAGLAAVAAAGGGRYSLTFELLPVPYGKFKLFQITTC